MFSEKLVKELDAIIRFRAIMIFVFILLGLWKILDLVILFITYMGNVL